MLLTTGDLAEADEAAGEALRLGESFNDLMGVARAHLSLGHIKAAADRHAAAHVHFDQSESIARRSGSLTMVMESLTGHGQAELALGHTDAAQALFEEALDALGTAGVSHCNASVAATLGLGWAALAHNDLPAATAHFEQVPRMAGCKAWERMDAMAGLAETHLAAGRAGEAALLLDQVLRSPATAYGTRLRAENDLADMLHADIPQALTGQN